MVVLLSASLRDLKCSDIKSANNILIIKALCKKNKHQQWIIPSYTMTMLHNIAFGKYDGIVAWLLRRPVTIDL